MNEGKIFKATILPCKAILVWGQQRLTYLVRCSGWDEDSISEELYDGVAGDTVLLQEAGTQLLIQVPALVVDWVVVGLDQVTTLFGYLLCYKTQDHDNDEHVCTIDLYYRLTITN